MKRWLGKHGAATSKVYIRNDAAPEDRPGDPTGSDVPLRNYGRASPRGRNRSSMLSSVVAIRNMVIATMDQHVSATTRQILRVLLSLMTLIYTLLIVPFRVGVLYDPIRTRAHDTWSIELSVLIAFDCVSDAVGMYEFVEFAHKVLADYRRHRAHKEQAILTPPALQGSANQRMSWADRTLSAISPMLLEWYDAHMATPHYKRLVVVAEITAALPIEVFLLGARRFNALHVVRLTKLGRLWRLSATLHLLHQQFASHAWVQTSSLAGISTVVRNVVASILQVHWAACIYVLIPHWKCGRALDAHDCAAASIEWTWVLKDRLVGASVMRQYSRALYWAARTTVLLGYDDVTPVSTLETVFALVVQISGAVLCTSYLATFLFIARYRNFRQAAFNAHIDMAREYMQLQSVPRDLRRRILSYFAYMWSTHQSLESEGVLKLLPKHLQAKVVHTLKASRITQVSFLAKESVEFVHLLARALVRRVYAPGDGIVEPTRHAHMCFVIRGTVLVYQLRHSNTSAAPRELESGDIVSEACLLASKTYDERVVAKTFCEVDLLTRSQLDAAIRTLYRGQESVAHDRLVQTYEKAVAQANKTKKLLGMANNGDHAAPHAGRRVSALSPASHADGPAAHVNWRYPDSVFRARWDFVRLLAIVYVAFEAPYYGTFVSGLAAQHSFLVVPRRTVSWAISVVIEAFFAVDMVLRCRFFAYLDPQLMLEVVDPAMIFASYKRRGAFLLDLIAVLPVAIVLEIIGGTAREYAWAFRLLRLLRMRFAVPLLLDVTSSLGLSSKGQLVTLLLLAVSLLLHFVACFWFEAAWVLVAWEARNVVVSSPEALVDLTRSRCLEMASAFANCSWIQYDCYGHIKAAFPVDDVDTFYQTMFAYVRSLYWAVVALTGVGYGDIVAFSTEESFFAAFWILLGGIVNFGVVGTMSSTIANLMVARRHYMEQLNAVTSVMQRAGISQALRNDIRQFYRRQFATRKKAYESRLLAHLPDQLCQQLSSLLHSQAIACISLLEGSSPELLEQVTGRLRHRTYQHGEALCLEGHACTEFGVLLHGKVNVYFRQRPAAVRAFGDGECFGLHELVLGRVYMTTILAASPVDASVMAKENWDALARQFADEVDAIRDLAQDAFTDELKRLQCVTLNLNRLKLKPHATATTTLLCKQAESQGNAEARQRRFRSYWTALLMLCTMYNALSVPYRIALATHLAHDHTVFAVLLTADLLSDLVFLVDISLKLYYFDCAHDLGLTNLWQRKLLNHTYLHSLTFKRDILALVPPSYPSASDQLVMSLCRLPRLLRCMDLWDFWDTAILNAQQAFPSIDVSSYLEPLKLLFFLLLGSHLAACVFLWISSDECAHSVDCWMHHDTFLHDTDDAVSTLYLRSFYWALTTLTLVGSREIASRRLAGTLWAAIVCLGCTFLIGFVIGEISELMLAMNQDHKNYKRRLEVFARFATDNRLPPALHDRAREYMEIHFEQTRGKDIMTTLHGLSANLHLRLTQELYGPALERLPITSFLTRLQVNTLALRIERELFIPGDEVLTEGARGTHLCILTKGVAAVLWARVTAPVAMLMENCLFGEVAFFLPSTQRCIATVKAVTPCDVLRVSQHAWRELWPAAVDQVDATTANEQRHAKLSILNWVTKRLRWYQQSAALAAKKAHQVLAKRALVPTTTEHRVQPRLRPARFSFLSPEALLLEHKARYLLAKADKYATAIARSSQHALMAGKSSRSVSRWWQPSLPGLSIRAGANTSFFSSYGLSRRGNGSRVSGSAVNDATMQQFFKAIKPASKRIVEYMDDFHLRELEEECWQRCVMLNALEHAIESRQKTLLSFSSAALRRLSVVVKKHISMERIDMTKARSMQVRPLQPRHDLTQKLFTLTSTITGVNRRRSVQTEPRPRLNPSFMVMPRAGSVQMLSASQPIDRVRGRLKRSQSLPLLDGHYLDHLLQTAGSNGDTDAKAGNKRANKIRCRKSSDLVDTAASINFELLQSCRRAKHPSLYRLYRRFVRWKHHLTQPEPAPTTTTSRTDGSRRASRQIAPPSAPLSPARVKQRRRARQQSTLLRFAVGRLLLSGATSTPSELQSLRFRTLLTRVSKAWDTVMLVIAIYYAFAAPLKAAFARDMDGIHALSAWIGIEYVLDLLVTFDVLLKFTMAAHRKRPAAAESTSHSHAHRPRRRWYTRLRSAIAPYDGWIVDVLALLPAEVVVVPARWRFLHDKLPFAEFWRVLCWSRLNHLLLGHRIQSLSDTLTHYVIYDLKRAWSEPRVMFARALATYVLLGHWIACVWFAASEAAFTHYARSWLSSDGMLVPPSFAGESTTDQHQGAVNITTTTHDAQTATHGASTAVTLDISQIPVLRKYVRALHFAVSSITTLFYGDIVSMNAVELAVELCVILWSIYIYGTLVGAHSQVLQARAHQKSTREQNLAALQHYLELNDVPTALQKHVRNYYISTWTRHRGDDDRAVLAQVSRSLREDVVRITLRSFSAQVTAFRSCEPRFVHALLLELQFVVCAPDEQVVVKGDVDRSMYFVAQGVVRVQLEPREQVRRAGEFFGELALLYGLPRDDTCTSMTASELYRLDHAPYDKLLRDFPEYRARNRREWTIAPASSECVVFAPTRSGGLDGSAAAPAVDEASLDDQVPHSFVYKTALELLSRMDNVDEVAAKLIVQSGRRGARRYLLRRAGVPTPRLIEDPESNDESPDTDAPENEGSTALRKSWHRTSSRVRSFHAQQDGYFDPMGE